MPSERNSQAEYVIRNVGNCIFGRTRPTKIHPSSLIRTSVVHIFHALLSKNRKVKIPI